MNGAAIIPHNRAPNISPNKYAIYFLVAENLISALP